MTQQVQYADSSAWVCALEIQENFDALTEQEKLYAHWMSRASFAGARIIMRQNARDAEKIFDLILELYRCSQGDWMALASMVKLSTEEMTFFLNYAAEFLTSYGYFTTYSGRKFIPQLSRERFRALACCSANATNMFENLADIIYSDDLVSLGYADPETRQTSNYYPGLQKLSNTELVEIQDRFQATMPTINWENTRLSETTNALDHCRRYELLVASVEKSSKVVSESPSCLVVVHGDHHEELMHVNEALSKALPYAATQEQRSMLESYIESFRVGSIDAHKLALGHWVRDRAPIVESLMGFVEYYRDPASLRGEWRGCVMIQNKKQTETFARLVEMAQEYLKLLPWPSDFEAEKFIPPDFTSMEALTFVSTNLPAGTNGPNYPDVKEKCGFKNIVIRNRVIQHGNVDISLLSAEDVQLYRRLSTPSFSVLVALHELLGHGSGKDLTETSSGVFNFDGDNLPINPLDDLPIKSWYAPGQSWKPLFGTSYEECRCECVALYLALFDEVMASFRLEEQGMEIEEVVYVAYLYVIRAGLMGLETWNPETRRWGSAHARARYVITRHLMEIGNDVLTVQIDDQSHAQIQLNRSRLNTHIRPAMENLLRQLHIYKSIAAATEGNALYDRLSEVDADMERVRGIILSQRVPKKQFVQCNTFYEDGKVILKEYEPTAAGIIQSWAERNV